MQQPRHQLVDLLAQLLHCTCTYQHQARSQYSQELVRRFTQFTHWDIHSIEIPRQIMVNNVLIIFWRIGSGQQYMHRQKTLNTAEP